MSFHLCLLEVAWLIDMCSLRHGGILEAVHWVPFSHLFTIIWVKLGTKKANPLIYVHSCAFCLLREVLGIQNKVKKLNLYL